MIMKMKMKKFFCFFLFLDTNEITRRDNLSYLPLGIAERSELPLTPSGAVLGYNRWQRRNAV